MRKRGVFLLFLKSDPKYEENALKIVTKIKYSLEEIKCKFDTTKYLNECFRVQTWEVIPEYKANE